MTKHWLILTLAATALVLFPASAEAANPFLKNKCECVGDYKPNKNVVKYYTVRVNKEWEVRQHCLPCGRKVPYKVKVITYRDRFSDGTQRTWKCVVAGTETPLETAYVK